MYAKYKVFRLFPSGTVEVSTLHERKNADELYFNAWNLRMPCVVTEQDEIIMELQNGREHMHEFLRDYDINFY